MLSHDLALVYEQNIEKIVCIHFDCFFLIRLMPLCVFSVTESKQLSFVTHKSVLYCIIYCGVLISVDQIKLQSFYNKQWQEMLSI
jgi:hypothetical protein